MFTELDKAFVKAKSDTAVVEAAVAEVVANVAALDARVVLLETAP